MDVIVRIEHLGDVFGDILFFHGADVVAIVEIVKIEFIRCRCLPETQVVHIVDFIAGNGDIPGKRHHVVSIDPAVVHASIRLGLGDDISAKAHPVCDFRAFYLPGTAFFEPVVWNFHLVALYDILLENAKFIADAIAIGGVGLRGEGIHKTGCQAP